jgi:hypothetical protein
VSKVHVKVEFTVSFHYTIADLQFKPYYASLAREVVSQAWGAARGVQSKGKSYTSPADEATWQLRYKNCGILSFSICVWVNEKNAS